MIEVTELDRRGTLRAAESCLAEQHRLDADQLALAAHWADLHDPDSLAPATTAFEQRRRRLEGLYGVQPGGAGTPEIFAACLAELGLVLRTSSTGAKHLVADALDLRHRLPRLWAEVQACRTRAWKARRVAQATRHLPRAVMAEVDAALAGLLGSLPWTRFQAVLDATVATADPAGARHAADEAAARRYVSLGRDRAHGLLTVIARGEVLDILTFLAAVQRIADLLALEGDPERAETLDVRRSRAVGLLGQPDRALALLRAHADDPHTATADGEVSTVEPDVSAMKQDDDEGDAEPEPVIDAPGRRSIDLWPPGDVTPSGIASIRVQLHVHLTDAALTGTDPAAVARVEGVGPVTAATVRRWLGRSDARITVRPVTVPGEAVPVDGYEIPHTVRDAVLHRSPATAFPWGSSTERRHLQLDHIEPYLDPGRGGPPRQTGPANLAPLTGPEHQNKTHRSWSSRSPAPGVHLWRSPHGWVTLVTNQGTFPLGATPTARAIWRAASAPDALTRAA